MKAFFLATLLQEVLLFFNFVPVFLTLPRPGAAGAAGAAGAQPVYAGGISV
jgi:hypothetical protein